MTVAAFVASAVLHALAVLIYPWLVGPPPRPDGPLSSTDRPVRGMEVVRIAEAPAPDAETPAEPAPELEEPEPAGPEAVEVPAEGPPTPEPIGPPSRRSRTAAEELRPRRGDPRLTAPLPAELVEVDKEWLARLRVIWALEQLNDSANAAAMAAAAGRDWTYTDGEGKKWGISPGKLHLGDVTLPLPSFSAPWNSEAARQAREDAEILRAALESATLETLEERARAIRERMDRERANRTPPDTTGGGGGGAE